MKRVSLFMAMMILAPAIALAQGVPPTPPPPPMAPLPAPMPAPPLPPEPPLPPAPPMPVIAPLLFDAPMVVDLQALRPAMIDLDAVREAALAQVQNGDVQRLVDVAREQARATSAEQRDLAQADRQAVEQAREAARSTADVWRLADNRLQMTEQNQQLITQAMKDQTFGYAFQDGEGSVYSQGLSAMTARQYDRAITHFDQAIAQKGTHADGALYWKAFSEYKLGKKDDALASLAELRKSYGDSKYLAEAKILEADIKKAGPEATDDDEIKLLAIQGIEHSDPERAVTALDGVLNASNSLQVKKRALYVLALSSLPRAHQILMDYARGARGNPDLQSTAIGYVAVNRSQTSAADLKAIYDATQDVNVKRSIIAAYGSAGDKASLINIMSGDSNPMVIRQSALSSLGSLASPQDLWTIYDKEPNKDLRLQIVATFGSMGALDQLTQVLKTEKDPQIRQRAIRSLGNMHAEKTGSMLVDLYSSDTDVDSRKAIIAALGNQNNADGLIALARKETANLELKRDIVTKIVSLSSKSKAAADYLLEVIGGKGGGR